MNNDQIIEILNSVSKKFGMAIDWSNKNILPYIEQLSNKIVKYDLYKSIFSLIVSITIILLSLIFMNLVYNAYKKTKINNEDNLFFTFITGPYPRYITIVLIVVVLILFIVSILGIISNIQNIIQDIVFPEKTIFEFIKPYLN